MAKWDTVTEDFSDTSFGAPNWSSTSGTPTMAGGVANLGPGGGFHHLYSVLHDLSESAVYFECIIMQPGNSNVGCYVRQDGSDGNSFEMNMQNNVLYMFTRVGGTGTTRYNAAYNSKNDRWWRWREASAVFYMETSPDGLTWTTRWSGAYTIDITSLQLHVYASVPVANVSPVMVDNINLAAARSQQPAYQRNRHLLRR